MMFKAKRVATEGTYFKQCKERVKLVLLEVVIRVGDFFFFLAYMMCYMTISGPYNYVIYEFNVLSSQIFLLSSCMHRASTVSKHFLLIQLMHTITISQEC